ncbi:MAG: hypothetical protein ACR2N6_06330, partial [Miltoncostaeaceae bacterium]
VMIEQAFRRLPARTEPVRRDRTWVEREYGDEKWPAIGELLDRQLAGDPSATLHRALFSVERAEWRASLPWPGRSSVEIGSSVGAARSVVLERVLELADGADLVVELGSGWGRNILTSWVVGGPPSALYCGAELTRAGRTVAARLAGLEPRLRFRSLPFDFTDPDLAPLGRHRRAIVFSRHGIEQVSTIDERPFLAAAELADHVVGVHLEPVGWQEGLGPDPDAAGRYAERHDYNRNLLAVLRRLDSAGVIRLGEPAVPDVRWPEALSAGCLVTWETPGLSSA